MKKWTAVLAALVTALAPAVNGLGRDATVCANELGVTMIMSITSFSNAALSVSEPYARNQSAAEWESLLNAR